MKKSDKEQLHLRAKDENKFLSVSTLARRWAISQSAVYSGKCATDRLKRYRFGRSVRFLRTDVEQMEREITGNNRNS